MIENIPESLKDKLKDVDLSKLDQRILDAKEMAKDDINFYYINVCKQNMEYSGLFCNFAM